MIVGGDEVTTYQEGGKQYDVRVRLAATDWSWSALFGDWNLDGHQDLFVSNGIPKRPNDLDFVRYISNDQISSTMDNTRLVDQEALEMMPSGNVHNYVFEGREGLGFEDRSNQWMQPDTLLSGATAWADFDADGDLDLVADEKLFRNTGSSNHWLKVRLQGAPPSINRMAIGAQVRIRIGAQEEGRSGFTSGLAPGTPLFPLGLARFALGAARMKPTGSDRTGIDLAGALDQSSQHPVGVPEQRRVGGPVDVRLDGRGVETQPLA